MCDFGAVGIWTKHGVMGDLEDLEADTYTIWMLGGWQNWYEMRRHDEDIHGLLKFVRYGWKIVWDIKRQHPDWTVVYHDERFGEDVIGMKLWLR